MYNFLTLIYIRHILQKDFVVEDILNIYFDLSVAIAKKICGKYACWREGRPNLNDNSKSKGELDGDEIH